MQKVERKKHGERRGRWVGLLFCAVLLAGCVAAALLMEKKAEGKDEPVRQHTPGTITQRNREELESIAITPREGEAWMAVRNQDGTLQPVGESWTIDGSVGEMLQDAAVNLTYEDIFTDNRLDWEPHAADFGLDRPLVTAEFRFTDGTAVTARIGDSADPDNDAYYYLTVDGDDRLYAIASGTVQDLRMEKSLMHSVPALEIHSALLDRITVRNADGSVRTEWKLKGSVSDQDAAESWMVTVPFAYPADYDAVKNLRSSAEKLRLGTYVDEDSDGNAEQYGLEKPSAIIELHMAAGSTGTVGAGGVYDVQDWEERTKTLTLGSARSEMVDYILYDGAIYTISHFSVSTFTETDALSTAARYPVATPLNSLESVMVERKDGEAVHYALLRQDGEQSEDEAGSAGTEQTVRCMRNGEEITYEAFAAAYERLLTVTVSGRLPEGFKPGKAEKKYTFRTVSGGTHTVELSDFDGVHDAVTMDGESLFYLIKDGMTELP